MALRAHLNQGRAALSEVVDSTPDSLPHTRGFMPHSGEDLS